MLNKVKGGAEMSKIVYRSKKALRGTSKLFQEQHAPLLLQQIQGPDKTSVHLHKTLLILPVSYYKHQKNNAHNIPQISGTRS